MPWIEPITDRNTVDVEYANVNKGSLKPNKGALNIAIELNRIEGNCQYIYENLVAYGYGISIVVKTNWVNTDFPHKADLDRIRSNIVKIRTAYYTLVGTPEMEFIEFLDWNDVNNMEQNLLNLKLLLERMIEGFRHCGGFYHYAGSEVVLP